MGKQSEQETRLLQTLNSNGNNNKCGECGASYPTWASWNLGVFLCGRCASIHRSLGPDVSQVKSLSLDTWSSYQLNALDSIGNKKNQSFWNNKRAPFPYDDDDKDSITLFLRDKYIYGKFTTHSVTQEDYGLDERGGSSRSRPRDGRSSSRSSSSRSRSRASSRPRGLTYRSITSSERSRYGDAARKLKFDMGFDDFDLNVEALAITNGNISAAADLLSREQSRGGSRRGAEGTPPPLPKRKPTSGALLDASKTGAVDWLSDATPAVPSSTGQVGQPDVQIYQYIDPTTGAIYYVDQNGQQYVDPQQQQQLLLQQQQAMLAQQQQMQFQAQKTGIMSMYNQPASTGISNPQITGAAPSMNDLQQQQQQQQQQYMMMMQQQQQQGYPQQPGYFNGF